jgi:beta-phosphoglucomutase-like phosphatase (HAD superfamily)
MEADGGGKDKMKKSVSLPGLGEIEVGSGLVSRDECSDGFFRVGHDGVTTVLATGDGKVEFVVIGERTIAYVRSAMGCPAYYPVHPVSLEKPVKAVLMDLDGTSVRSETFWIWIIEQTIASLRKDPGFRLEEADQPYVSGHSVSEHLKYCIDKYCPGHGVEEGRVFYFEHAHREMDNIVRGEGRTDAFVPTPGLKEFLLELKRMKIKIALVTSGLYEKSYPEIVSAFRTLEMGDPSEFYDAIITAGFPFRRGEIGTLGELSPKPHPWLYSEVCRVGLGIEPEDRSHVLGIEDSGAGVCSIRIAGHYAVGLAGGNIVESGTRAICNAYCENFEEVLAVIR